NHDESFVFCFGDAYGVIIFGRGNLAQFGCAVGDSNSLKYSSATVGACFSFQVLQGSFDRQQSGRVGIQLYNDIQRLLTENMRQSQDG
ncbi:hypothetical protein Tco_1199742, partial [Tanacetum coccineum]